MIAVRTRRAVSVSLGLLMGMLSAGVAPAGQDWKPAPVPISTRWAKDVSPEHAHPEYPRPQMTRPDWVNLNGLWSYAITSADSPAPSRWDGQILVPFPVESSLSGVGKAVNEVQRLWYRRSFEMPRIPAGGRLLLHFGAVDWNTTVFLNGQKIGEHRGGYDPFTFDVTGALKPAGEQELLVEVADPTGAGTQPRGKQVLHPGGIFYTASTGIWQTVWLEPVAAAHIESLKIVPDLDHHAVLVAANTTGGEAVTLTGTIEGRAFTATGKPGEPIRIDAVGARPWTPDAPTLYNFTATLQQSGKPADSVGSYFALRKISLGKDEKGITRMMLNNRFVFEFGPLDQGFWPEGLYTAPTQEAMEYDLHELKKFGCNMLRKHVKVEPATYYAACDRLGLLVWQDMPSGDRYIRPGDADIQRTADSAADYKKEWHAIIDALQPFPCIVMWVPFNEGWGQFDTAEVVALTRQWDPTRLVDEASGWADRGVGDVHDMHHYPHPAMFPAVSGRATVLGEFGGLGLALPDHLWQNKSFSYRGYSGTGPLTDAFISLMSELRPLVGQGLSAAVYTQTTDVEGEVNGMMTYDREVVKIDPARAAAAIRKLYLPPPVIQTLVPDARGQRVTWRYTTEKPAADWSSATFDDSAWKQGPGGFGTAGTPHTVIGSRWKGPDIWVRRTFKLSAAPAGDVALMLHHDEDAEVYLDGVLAAHVAGFTTDYNPVPITGEAARALHPGDNTLAIHCRQTVGGQYIDAGLVEMIEQRR